MPIRMCGGCPTEVANSLAPCQTSTLTYVGAVLDTGERNGHDDSDFYATVWDADAGTLRDVEYASTRGWSYHNGVTVDATPETVAAAMRWWREQRIAAAIGQAHADARAVTLGCEVRSLTTRGKNAGVTGVVEWIGEDRYRSRAQPVMRVGLRVPGENARRYVAMDRVELVTVEPVDEDAIRRDWATRPMGEPAWSDVLRGLAMSATARS